MKWIILIAALLLTGCISIETQLQPINPAVKASLYGEDCSPIIFGFGFGTNTVEQAMLKGDKPVIKQGQARNPLPITQIRSVSFYNSNVLSFGKQCVTVTGEP